MPELPEVETIVRDLRHSVLGARVTAVWGSGLPLRLARPVELEKIRKTSAGRLIAAVRRRAKYILIDFQAARGEGEASPGGLLIHLGMSGRVLVQAASVARPAHTHVVWSLADGRELRYCDPRRFGFVAAGTPVDACPELAALGPDPLAELTPDQLARRLAGARTPIKAFLLDQTRVAGLGNIYVCEALHRAGIHPLTEARRTLRRASALLLAIREALESGIANRGTTLRDYVDSSGAVGNNAAALRVYGREGEACPVCGRPVQRRVDAGRSTFFCAGCQRRRR